MCCKRLQKGCRHGPNAVLCQNMWSSCNSCRSAISPASREAQGLLLVVHSVFLSPLLGDVDRVLHAVVWKTGCTAHCDLSVSGGHLSAVARQVSQFLLLFRLTWVMLKFSPWMCTCRGWWNLSMRKRETLLPCSPLGLTGRKTKYVRGAGGWYLPSLGWWTSHTMGIIYIICQKIFF